MEDAKQLIIKVDGMTCVNCARAVETAIADKGGQKIVVNLAEKEVVFENVSGESFDTYASQITSRGYTVLSNNAGEDIKKKR
jgi:copper chaperone CopZ